MRQTAMPALAAGVPGERHAALGVEGGDAHAVEGARALAVTAGGDGVVRPALVAGDVDGGAGDGDGAQGVATGVVGPRGGDGAGAVRSPSGWRCRTARLDP